MRNSEEIWINDWDAYICAGKNGSSLRWNEIDKRVNCWSTSTDELYGISTRGACINFFF